MPCASCIRALEQGAYALYELEAFRPELLPPLPATGLTDSKAVAEYLILAAACVRNDAPAPQTVDFRPTSSTTGEE